MRIGLLRNLWQHICIIYFIHQLLLENQQNNLFQYHLYWNLKEILKIKALKPKISETIQVFRLSTFILNVPLQILSLIFSLILLREKYKKVRSFISIILNITKLWRMLCNTLRIYIYINILIPKREGVTISLLMQIQNIPRIKLGNLL